MAKKASFRYRDKRTGRFVSKTSAKGRKPGKVKRERIRKPLPIKKAVRRPIKRRKRKNLTDEGDFNEYLVGWKYEKSGKVLDFVVVADSEDAALESLSEFMQEDSKLQHITSAGFSGWTPKVARGRRAREKRAGEVVYRESNKKRI